jgi:NADH-quinone oxidoreductase subunit E
VREPCWFSHKRFFKKAAGKSFDWGCKLEVSQKEITQVLKTYPKEKRHSLAILLDMQHKFGYIPKEALEAVSSYLSVKISALYSMATFYRALSLKPGGKHLIKVCDGTACHIRGAPVLLDALTRSLKIKPGETSKDGLFTLETVNCLGACAIAPVMVVDEKYHSKVKPDELDVILSGYKGKTNG